LSAPNKFFLEGYNMPIKIENCNECPCFPVCNSAVNSNTCKDALKLVEDRVTPPKFEECMSALSIGKWYNNEWQRGFDIGARMMYDYINGRL
jgi:hypothetical protein